MAPAGARAQDRAPDHGPLLIVCALGIEQLALRTGARPAGPGTPVVLRTGMGPRAAERAVRAALADGSYTPDTAVVAAGFCAGLAPGMRPGDLVVADETREYGRAGPDTHRTRCTDTARLAEALTGLVRDRPGTIVHTGPLTGTEHIVRGGERARLHAAGAIAVDMETAVTLRTATASGARPVAAVRVVVDAPEHELVRVGTLRGGISAFRVLRKILPAFHEWHRSLPLHRR